MVSKRQSWDSNLHSCGSTSHALNHCTQPVLRRYRTTWANSQTMNLRSVEGFSPAFLSLHIQLPTAPAIPSPNSSKSFLWRLSEPSNKNSINNIFKSRITVSSHPDNYNWNCSWYHLGKCALKHSLNHLTLKYGAVRTIFDFLASSCIPKIHIRANVSLQTSPFDRWRNWVQRRQWLVIDASKVGVNWITANIHQNRLICQRIG